MKPCAAFVIVVVAGVVLLLRRALLGAARVRLVVLLVLPRVLGAHSW